MTTLLDCPECEGDGYLETCWNHPGDNCPCRTRRISCEACGGSGKHPCEACGEEAETSRVDSAGGQHAYCSQCAQEAATLST